MSDDLSRRDKTRLNDALKDAPRSLPGLVKPIRSKDGSRVLRGLPQPRSLRMDRPETMGLLVNSYILHGCDLDWCLQSNYPTLPEEDRAALKLRIESDDRFKKAVAAALSTPGLDDSSRDEFVREMWTWLKSRDKVLAPTAARILGRGFIGEKPSDDKPQPLPLAGVEAGVRAMGLHDEDKEVVQ